MVRKKDNIELGNSMVRGAKHILWRESPQNQRRPTVQTRQPHPQGFGPVCIEDYQVGLEFENPPPKVLVDRLEIRRLKNRGSEEAIR
jgi:hypothetical protein